MASEVGNFSFDFGAVEYYYVTDIDTSYPEIYGFAKYKFNDTLTMGTKVYYAPDYSQLGFSALYAEGNTTVALPNNFSFSGALGYQTFATGGRPDYLTWNAGLSYTWKSLTFDVRYWDTDLSNGECAITNSQQQCLRSSRRCIGFARHFRVGVEGAHPGPLVVRFHRDAPHRLMQFKPSRVSGDCHRRRKIAIGLPLGGPSANSRRIV